MLVVVRNSFIFGWPILLVLVFALTSCGQSDLCRVVKLSEESTLNGRINAVVSEKDCGATTSDVIRVHLLSSSSDVDEDKFIFLADHVEELSVTWITEKTLLIEYKKARIFQFTNFWQSEELDHYNTTISILERQVYS